MTDVTLSTKCWDGDYRHLLTSDGIRELFAGFGPAARKQVVLNRIADRSAAEAQAQALVDDRVIDEFAWAEDHWPSLARRLAVPETWWGPAWPYAVPELTELAIARTPVVAHVAGDVRLEPGDDWLPRAVAALTDAQAVSPVSPSRIELTRPEARRASSGWVDNFDFSDQCFVVRAHELLTPELVRATHPANGRYPKPGGALTFEARAGAWLRTTGGRRRIDVTRGYLHPVGGVEGSSYRGLAGPLEHLPPVPQPSTAYPPAGTADAVAVVVARNAVRTIGWTVASLRWAREVVVVDQRSEDGTAQRAAEAGARVVEWPAATVTGRAALADVAGDLSGWLLIVDADEVVPPQLAHVLAELVAADEVDGVEVARATHLLGKPARSGAHWPAYELRLLRAERGIFPWGLEAVRQPVRLQSGARTTRLPADPELAVVKLARPDLHAWLTRLNERTTLESRGIELPGNRSSRRALKRLAIDLVRHRSYRDGRHGWRLAVLDALAKWVVTEKAWDNVAGGATAVAAHYDEIAASIVTERPPG